MCIVKGLTPDEDGELETLTKLCSLLAELLGCKER